MHISSHKFILIKDFKVKKYPHKHLLKSAESAGDKTINLINPEIYKVHLL